MMLSQPQPQLSSPLPIIPLPQPPQQKSKMMIQIKELHPHPLFTELHPHPVAVKSLIYIASKRFCFMVYHMRYGLYVFPCAEKLSENFFKILLFFKDKDCTMFVG